MVKKKKKSGKKSFSKKTAQSVKNRKNLPYEFATSKSKEFATGTKKVSLGSKSIIPYRSFGQKLFDLLQDSKSSTEKKIPKNLSASPNSGKRDVSQLLKKIVVVVTVLASSAAIFVVLELISDGRTLPFTALASEDLGYLKETELRVKVENLLATYEKTPINFEINEQVIPLSPVELGIQLPLEKNLLNLPKFTIEQQNLLDFIGIPFGTNKIFAHYEMDTEVLANKLEDSFKLSLLRAQSATFSLQDNKTFQIIPEKEGQILDLEDLIAQLQSNMKNLDSKVVSLNMKPEKPTVTSKDLQEHQVHLSLLLKTPLSLEYGSNKYKLNLTNHLETVNFTKNLDFKIVLDRTKLMPVLEKEILSKIEVPASGIKISTNSQQKIIFEGDARDGIMVNKKTLIAVLEDALNTQNTKVLIPVDIIKSPVEASQDLQALGIQELIGVGHTAFAGSPNGRITNIKIGFSKYDGLMIKPGETFSFNDNLGEVDAENGFVKELVIKAEGTVPEFGGGVCQVSSTIYKAALWSGLPIVERYPHSYAVSYYAQVDGYGLDSTIYPGIKDLHFTNDTPSTILMQAYTQGDNGYFKFYGTSDGRKVSMEGPYKTNARSAGGTQLIPTKKLLTGQQKKIESAHPGFDITWYRYLSNPEKTGQSQEPVKEKIFSSYRATANRYLIGE